MYKQLSYTCGVMSKPFIHCTIPDIISARSQLMPNTEAFVHYKPDKSRESITYKALHEKSVKMAEYLITRGVRKGDTVALMGPNTINRLIGEFGIIMSGGIVLHISTSLKNTSDILELLSKTNSKYFLVDQREEQSLNPFLGQLLEHIASHKMTKCSEIFFLGSVENFARLPSIDMESTSQCNHALLPPLDPEEPIVMFSSSGSTGKPKLIEHTHFNVINQCLRHVIAKDKTVNVFYNDRPFDWAGGSPLFTLPMSNTRVFVDSDLGLKKEFAKTIWEIIRKEQCEFALLMPCILSDLTSSQTTIQGEFLLKGLVLSGQQITDNLIQSTSWMTESIVVPYGATETMYISSTGFIRKGDTCPTGCVGNPLPGTEIKITDKDGKSLERGQNGEIHVRSSFNSRKYVANIKATDQAYTRSGWFKTGDVGFISNNGQLTVRGRLSFRISRGEEKISPELVEYQISQMQGIKNVIVVPVPDKLLLQEVCACFVSMEDCEIYPEEVDQYCSKKMLNIFTMDGTVNKPKYYLRFDELSMLSNGKPDRQSIKKQAELLLFRTPEA